MGGDRAAYAAAGKLWANPQDQHADVVNAIFYIAQSGRQWLMLPTDFPPFTTVQRYSTLGVTMGDGRPSTTRC